MPDATPLPGDLDPEDLRSAGWAVVLAPGLDPDVERALEPLLRLRRLQASARYQRLGEAEAPSAEESAEAFLARFGEGTGGCLGPEGLPYYLLLVGSPEQIGFTFQVDLAVSHGVGRLWFETSDEFAAYARAVVAAESRSSSARLAAFAPSYGQEITTQQIRKSWTEPILDRLESLHPEWRIERYLGKEASLGRFSSILGSAPALLFFAGHGLFLRNGDPDQAREQGAIVCSEWPGEGPMAPGTFFAASQVDPDLDLSGMIAFLGSCFSAGTSSCDELQGVVPHDDWIPPEAPFLARLPQRLLSLAEGRAALAVVGHLDRVWRYSFLDRNGGEGDWRVVQQVLRRLMTGRRVGHAMEPLRQWHARGAARLTSLYLRLKRDEAVDSQALARTWMIHNDAKNYIVLGDPAVRCAR